MTDTNMSLEDVLDALMLEEQEPSYAALVRWSKRYPQYRDELTRYFATWSLQRLRAEDPEPDPVVVDEEKLVARTVDYALDLARRQGRLAPAASIEPLSSFDQLMLTAVYLLRGAGYSVNISDKVSDMSGKPASLGATFASLSRLERLGLITARVSDPETDAEHKGRRYFTATPAAERVLAEAKETSKIVADFLGDFA
jgi:hypothetical protein